MRTNGAPSAIRSLGERVSSSFEQSVHRTSRRIFNNSDLLCCFIFVGSRHDLWLFEFDADAAWWWAAAFPISNEIYGVASDEIIGICCYPGCTSNFPRAWGRYKYVVRKPDGLCLMILVLPTNC